MIFTVNVIDWQQSVLDNSHSVSNQVWKNTLLMLNILRKNEVTGTFFIQNKVASKYPVLIRKIASEGHEIGCFFDMPYHSKSFKEVVSRAVQELEDITDMKVIGTRSKELCPSKNNFNPYCRALKKMGIKYDSSLTSNDSIRKHEKKNVSLEAFQDYQIAQYSQTALLSAPLQASGFYKYFISFGDKAFRLLPYEFNHLLSRQLNKDTSVFSIPVYDLGADDYSIMKLSYQLSFARKIDFLGRQSIPEKLQKLLADYPFDSFKNYYYKTA